MKTKRLFLAMIAMLIIVACSCSKTPKAEESEGYYLDGSDVHISQSGTTIKDMTITGDLYIDESVGDGEFYVEQCEVAGSIYVRGGGPNSGYFINVIGRDLIIESDTNPKIVLGMNTSMEGIQIASDCSVTTDGGGADQVKINSDKTQEAVNVIMSGNYPQVSIESTANVKIDGQVSLMSVLKQAGMTSIELVDTSKVYFYSSYGKSVTISGGTIVEAWINAEYCSLPEDTGSVYSEVGVADVTVGDVNISLPARVPSDDSPQSNNDEGNGEETDSEDSTPDKTSNQENDNTSDQADDQENDNSDDQENDNSDGQDDEAGDFVDADAPTAVSSGSKWTIKVTVQEHCKIYVMVEDRNLIARQTTPEKVKAGISDGPSVYGSDYTIIHAAFNATQVNTPLSFVVDMAAYIPGDDVTTAGTGIFVVLEDMAGNLSQVYAL